MVDIAALSPLNKSTLIGGCMRLPIQVDSARLSSEVSKLPPEVWGTTAGRIAVHRDAQAVFLRGYAPQDGDKPIEDRPVLDTLPYAREIIETMLGAKPLRSLLARLAPGGIVTEHADRGDYFARTIRIHVPIVSNANVSMLCAGRCYSMMPGEVWALNNSTRHAVWNADTNNARTHMITDFPPTPELLALLGRGERELGRTAPDVEQTVRATSSGRNARR